MGSESAASASSSTSAGSGGASWPYPGDGYNEQLWHVYDASMASLYFLLGLSALVNFILAFRARKTQNQLGTRSNLRLAFYILVMLQTLMRAVFFSLVYTWREVPQGQGDPRMKTLAALIMVSDTLYFTTYSVLLMFWANIDMTSRGRLQIKVLIFRLVIAANAALYIMVIGAGIVVSHDPSFRKKLYTATIASICAFSIVVAVSFLFFGYRLYRKFRSFSNEHASRLLWQIIVISGCCFACYIYRGVYIGTMPTRQFGNIAWSASYFLLGEIVPISILLVVFVYYPNRSSKAVKDNARTGEKAHLNPSNNIADDDEGSDDGLTQSPFSASPANTIPRDTLSRSSSGSYLPPSSQHHQSPIPGRGDYGAVPQSNLHV